MKRLFTFLIITVLLLCTVNVSAATTSVSSIQGPTSIIDGEDFEVTVSYNGNSVVAVEGEVTFDGEKITYKSASVDLSNWELEVNCVGNIVYFATANNGVANPINGNVTLLTLTFTVDNAAVGEQLTLTAENIASSSASGVQSVEKSSFTATVAEKATESTQQQKPTNGNNSTISGPSNNSTISGPSNNNRLASLVVKNAEISPAFDPEIKEYYTTVPFEIEELDVGATAADENAKIEIVDTKLIYIGTNITRVKVVSESGLQRTYKIYATREEPTADDTVQVTENSFNWLLWLIIGIAALLVIAAIVFVIIILRKKRNKN